MVIEKVTESGRWEGWRWAGLGKLRRQLVAFLTVLNQLNGNNRSVRKKSRFPGYRMDGTAHFLRP
jgi:hypothetical protein